MYLKCERMEDVAKVFEGLEERNDVLWNVMIRGYVYNGEVYKVMELFMDMRGFGYNVDDFIFISLLSICVVLYDFDMGSQFYSVIIKKKLADNLFVGNVLVDMYVKCGGVEDVRKVFECMWECDNVLWNMMIGGYV